MYNKGRRGLPVSVKNNQHALFENIKDSFRFLKPASFDENIDTGHGRIEKRKCTVIVDLAHIDEPRRWKSLSVLVKMENERYFKATGVIEKATRYYIGSKIADAGFYQQNIRDIGQ